MGKVISIYRESKEKPTSGSHIDINEIFGGLYSDSPIKRGVRDVYSPNIVNKGINSFQSQ